MCSSPFFACLVCFSYLGIINFSLATGSSTFCAGKLFLFEIAVQNKSALLTFFPMQIRFFHPKQALCYLLSAFLLIYWFWWLLLEATSKIHNFVLGLLPCLSPLHNFRSSAVPTVANSLHYLREIFYYLFGRFLVRIYRRKFFSELGN